MTGTSDIPRATIKLPFWATLLMITGVIILCALGTWQIQRLAWKNDILAKLDAAYENPETNPNLSTLAENDFIYGTMKGRLLFDKSILLGHMVQNDKPGHFLITPLETSQGTLLINMGFTPNDQPLETHPVKSSNGQTLKVSGIIRQPKWNSFTPENNPEKNTWYRADTKQIATAQNLKNTIPFVMYADSASRKFDAAFPNNERWAPNNNHGQYAFFWFALASSLIVIYILRFLRK